VVGCPLASAAARFAGALEEVPAVDWLGMHMDHAAWVMTAAGGPEHCGGIWP